MLSDVIASMLTAVIASVAKQSMVGSDMLHGLLRYARNDGTYCANDNQVAR